MNQNKSHFCSNTSRNKNISNNTLEFSNDERPMNHHIALNKRRKTYVQTLDGNS